MKDTDMTCEGQQEPVKKWDELNADEKIERMRTKVKELEAKLNRMEGRYNNMHSVLYSHFHGEKGIWVPAHFAEEIPVILTRDTETNSWF